MMFPRKALEDELTQQEKELTDDINNLNKKVPFSCHFDNIAITVCYSRNISRSNSRMRNLNYET